MRSAGTPRPGALLRWPTPLRAGVAVVAVAGAVAAVAGAVAAIATRVPGAEIPPGTAAGPRAPGAGGPLVALLATPPAATTTSLYLARAGDPSPGEPVATLHHLEDAVVRGAVLAGSAVVLVSADVTPAGDASFGASLLRLAPHRAPQVLADRLVHGGRPVVTAAGRVFVSRGEPGPDPHGAIRVDALTLDEIDPATGAARTVYAAPGYLLNVAGVFGRELVVYRVGPGGAALLAVDPDAGIARTVVPELPPYARDFSVDADAGALFFQARDEDDTRAYTLDRVDLVSGLRKRLYTSTSPSLAPFAWPGGGVAYSHEGRDGIALLGGTRPLAIGALGAGVDLVQAVSADAVWVAGVHTAPGLPPAPFVVDTRTGAAAWLPVPAGTRAAVAGFVTESPASP